MDIKDINIRNLQSEIARCIVPDRTRVQGQGGTAQRYRFRLEYSASIVGKIMSLLKKIRSEKDKYGALVMRAVNYILDDEEAFKKFL